MTNEITQESTVIPALEGGHEYVIDTSVGINGFTFALDGKTAEVNLKCTKTPGETHTHTIEAVVTSQVKTPATCTEKGVTTYTATYGYYSESIDKTDINALGHDWEFVDIVIANNGKTATANYVCKHDSTHTTSIAAEITDDVLVPATCETGGTTRYTATVTTVTSLDHLEHSDYRDVNDLDPLGHTWTFVDFVFSDDGKSATANYVCSHDGDHKTSVTATVVGEVTTPATCEVEGTTTYTATVQAEDTPDGVVRKATTTRDDVDAIGHNYVTYYKWSCGSTDVISTKTCLNDTTDKTITTSSDVATSSTYVHSGRLSPMGREINTTGENWKGDINLEFSNNNSDNSKGRGFETTITVRFVSTSALTTMKVFSVKVDNAQNTGSGNSGSNRTVFNSDMTANVSNFDNLGGSDSLDNNIAIGNDASSPISSTSALYSAFRAFMMDCDIVIHVKADPETKLLLIEVSYYTNVEGYESYRGYTQTIRSYFNGNITSWNDANSVRIARMVPDTSAPSTTLEIKSIEYTPNLYADIYASICKKDSKSGIWGFQYYETIDTKLIDVAGV